MRARIWVAVLAVCAAAAGCDSAAADPVRVDEHFAGPDGLIAAEHHPATDDPVWLLTSGSLYRVDGQGWSGIPDAGDTPDGTGSAVFRMVSADRSFGDVVMTVKLRVDNLVQTARTPAQNYDGVHIWVRYRSDKELYAISVDRRDGSLIIKKKCAGGTENGGTYFDLTAPVRGAAIPFGQWQQVTVQVTDRPDGSVAINASRDGFAVEASDTGVGCAPLTGDGSVGIRGDNADFRLAGLVVEDVAP
ncbi:hypothetical protein [Mycolicibacterium mengxianglii]|uniref:hypothetical protein n=1 Tax=Mycolicibacterium mengxianglii TaxID=2736649 RepID=UPI0018EEEFF4|nr:hypothetical protein [Mycolicibacterium mengxianglii]